MEWNKAAILKHVWVLAAKALQSRYVFYIQCFSKIDFVGVLNQQIMVAGFVVNFYM